MSFKPYNAYVVAALRTPGGKKNGLISNWHPVELGATVIDALVEQTGIDGSKVDDVVLGCVSQVGAQSNNLGRQVVLASKKLPETVPGTTCERQCGSGQQAMHFAAQAVMSGTQDVVIAGGVEAMSLVPLDTGVYMGKEMGHGVPLCDATLENYGKAIEEGYGNFEIDNENVMFMSIAGAELLARKYEIDREAADAFAFSSQQKALNAKNEGKFDKEIVPIESKTNDKYKGKQLTEPLSYDEGIRKTLATTLAKLPRLHPNGIVTAGNAGQICDGASAVLICNEKGLEKLGIKPRMKIVSMAVAASCPILGLEAPIPATRKALEQANLTIDDIDRYEVNEGFCIVPLCWQKALNADMEKLNVNGGAIALGNPQGSAGTKLTATLLHELERIEGRYGLLVTCQSAGTSNATIFERVTEASA